MSHHHESLVLLRGGKRGGGGGECRCLCMLVRDVCSHIHMYLMIWVGMCASAYACMHGWREGGRD